MVLDYWTPRTGPTGRTSDKSLTNSSRSSSESQTRTLDRAQYTPLSSSEPLDTERFVQQEKEDKEEENEEETVQLKDNPVSSTPTSLSSYSSCEELSLCNLTDNGNLHHLLQKQLDEAESSVVSRNKTHDDHHRPQACSSSSQDKEKPALEEQCSTNCSVLDCHAPNAQVVSPTVETTTTLLSHHHESTDSDNDTAVNSLNEQDQNDSWNHEDSVSPPPATSGDPMVQSCCLSSPPPPAHNEGLIPDNSEMQDSATHGPSPVDEVDNHHIKLPPTGETSTAASNNVVVTAAATLEAVQSTPSESSANPRSPSSSFKCSSSNVSLAENKLETARESPSLHEEILVAGTVATNCEPQSSKQVVALDQSGRTVTTDDELLLDESFQHPQQEDGLVVQEEDNEQRASSPQQESSASQENQKDDGCVSSNATRKDNEETAQDPQRNGPTTKRQDEEEGLNVPDDVSPENNNTPNRAVRFCLGTEHAPSPLVRDDEDESNSEIPSSVLIRRFNQDMAMAAPFATALEQDEEYDETAAITAVEVDGNSESAKSSSRSSSHCKSHKHEMRRERAMQRLFDEICEDDDSKRGERDNPADQGLENTHKNAVLPRRRFLSYLKRAGQRSRVQVDQEVLGLALNVLVGDNENTNNTEELTGEDFFTMFQRHPSLNRALLPLLSSSSLEHDDEEEDPKPLQNHDSGLTDLKKPKALERSEDAEIMGHARTRSSWKNRDRFMIWVAMYLGATVSAFVTTAISWAQNEEATQVFGNCVVVARAAANVLNLHGALILLPMAHLSLTYLRQISVLRGLLFPIDAERELHIVIGIGFAIFSTVHVGAHICDIHCFMAAESYELEDLFGEMDLPGSKYGRLEWLLKQRVTITGVLMVVIMTVAYVLCFYRKKFFNLFWYSHHLFFLALVLMCVHGTGNLLQHHRTSYWLSVPVALYLIPRIYREIKCSNASTIRKVEFYGDVMNLELEKPRGWDCALEAGMWGFVNVPEVSRFEWHPFTMTSSPFQDHLSFHIRDVGDWTGKVHKLLRNCKDTSNVAKTRVRVEGPMGAPTQDFANHEVVVLVGAGIGITPMVSVIRQLLHKHTVLRRAFFYWTVRDNTCFDWFNTLLDELYQEDPNGCLEVRHFVSSAKHDDRDIGSVLFQHAADAVHAETNLDVLLGQKTHHQVQVGRPNWKHELQHVVNTTRAISCKTCGVFLCGPDGMAQEVRETTEKLAARNRDLRMTFSKETF